MNRFRLYQDGLMVAAGSYDDWNKLSSEAVRYLAVYVGDGPDKFRLVIDPDSSYRLRVPNPDGEKKP